MKFGNALKYNDGFIFSFRVYATQGLDAYSRHIYCPLSKKGNV